MVSLDYVLYVDSLFETSSVDARLGWFEGWRCAGLLPPVLDTPCSCALAGGHAENVLDPSDDTFSFACYLRAVFAGMGRGWLLAGAFAGSLKANWLSGTCQALTPLSLSTTPLDLCLELQGGLPLFRSLQGLFVFDSTFVD